MNIAVRVPIKQIIRCKFWIAFDLSKGIERTTTSSSFKSASRWSIAYRCNKKELISKPSSEHPLKSLAMTGA